MKTVWLAHPDLPDQPIEVPEQSVTIYSHSGWVLRDEPEKTPEQEVEVDVHGQPVSATSKASKSADTEESKPEPEDTKKTTGAKGSSKSAASGKGSDS